MNIVRKLLQSLPVQTLLAVLGFFLYRDWILDWMFSTGHNLGAVSDARHFVPFYSAFHDTARLTLWLVPALSITAFFLFAVYRAFLLRTAKAVPFLLFCFLSFVLISVSVAMIDGIKPVGELTVPAVMEPFTKVAYEYFGDVPLVAEEGPGAFLREYASPEYFETLSGHAKTHPPGGSLFQWLASLPFGYHIWSGTLFTILFTGLAIIPVFLTARLLYGDRIAQWAICLWLLVPTVLMYTATCMDGPFMVFPVWSIYFFYRSIAAERKLGWAIALGIAVALAMLMTYATFFLGLFFAVVFLIEFVLDKKRGLEVLRTLVTAALVFAASYLLLFIVTGFNFVETLLACVERDEIIMEGGHETFGHYLQISFANLIVYFVGAGFSLSIAWGREWVRAARCVREGFAGDIYTLAFGISVVLIAFATLFTMETERIWIFMTPFLVIPAARHLHGLCEQKSSLFPYFWVAITMAVQVVVAEAVLYTYW